MRRPRWCTKQWQNAAQVLHNNRIKFPKDFFRYCSVHQLGRCDVTWSRVMNVTIYDCSCNWIACIIRLTVDEHLWFYARMKGMPWKDVKREMDQWVGMHYCLFVCDDSALLVDNWIIIKKKGWKLVHQLGLYQIISVLEFTRLPLVICTFFLFLSRSFFFNMGELIIIVYKITKIVRAFWLVKNPWFIVPVNS